MAITMTRAKAEAKYGAQVVAALIELTGWIPQPEPVVEKTPWDVLYDAMYDKGHRVTTISELRYSVKYTAEAAGIKLIKASDELVAAPEPAAMQVLYEVGNASYGLHISRALCLAADLYRKGYVIAKRAGS